MLTMICPHVIQCTVALDESSSRLDEIVDNDHMPALSLALLHSDYALVAVPDLAANDLREVFKGIVKPLPGALVRVCNGDVVVVRKGLEAFDQERDTALKQRKDCITKVKAFLKSMDVKNDQAGGATSRRWDVCQYSCKRESSGHIALRLHSLHGPSGKEGQDQGEGAHKESWQGIDDRDLSRIVKGSE